MFNAGRKKKGERKKRRKKKERKVGKSIKYLMQIGVELGKHYAVIVDHCK
jgi:hypothetical protein